MTDAATPWQWKFVYGGEQYSYRMWGMHVSSFVFCIFQNNLVIHPNESNICMARRKGKPSFMHFYSETALTTIQTLPVL